MSSCKKGAIEVAEIQGELASSPAELEPSGQIKLCAAACLACAGIEIREGKPRADSFVSKLTGPKGKSLVENVFDQLGWGKKLCSFIMINNDNADKDHRILEFKRMLG